MRQKIGRMQTILIVEDSDDDYEATERAFREVKLENPILRCEDGQDALDLLYHQGKYQNDDIPRPGIIFLDLNMPGVDGRKVLTKIKSDQSLKDIPVVILTTSDNEKDVKECYQTGANTYIQKPVDLDHFIDSVKSLKEYWFETALLPH